MGQNSHLKNQSFDDIYMIIEEDQPDIDIWYPLTDDHDVQKYFGKNNVTSQIDRFCDSFTRIL